jgi:hypothetical protein
VMKSSEVPDLLTSDAQECSKMIEELAMTTFTGRGKLVETAIREWLVTNRPGTAAERHEFHEAVVHVLKTKWGHL